MRRVFVAVLVVAVATTCVVLGCWQLGRWREKHALALVYRHALAAAPVPLPAAPESLAAVRESRVLARGTYDETQQVLLSDRWRGDSAGIEVLTPLRLAQGGVLLVDRGWLAAADGIHARLDSLAEPGSRAVLGLLEPLPRGLGAAPWQRLPGAGGAWSARVLDADSLRAYVALPLWPWVLRALPEPNAPARPARALPEPPNETMHLSYAAQWFTFALIAIVGSLVAARRSKRPRPPVS